MGSLSLLQWIFSTQESNWGLLHCRQILYQLSYQGSPYQTQGLFSKREKLIIFKEKRVNKKTEDFNYYSQRLREHCICKARIVYDIRENSE